MNKLYIQKAQEYIDELLTNTGRLTVKQIETILKVSGELKFMEKELEW